MKKNNYGFTLVELVVVVVILSILTTVGFISYESYVSNSRDSKRLAQLSTLRDSLRIYGAEYKLPIPDDAIEFRQDGKLFAYQGYLGETGLETLTLDSNIYDPKDEIYFTYQTSSDRDTFQLMGYLENNPIEDFVSVSSTFASVNYNKRFPKVFGQSLGILMEGSTQSPIQEVEPFKTQKFIDFELDASGMELIAQIADNSTLNGQVNEFLGLVPFSTCKKLLDDGKTTSGLYIINPTGQKPLQVYCDMVTDGGGWTFTSFIGLGGGNLGLFTGDAGTYRADRLETSTSYGLDTTVVPHDEVYIVRGQEDVTPQLLASGSVMNFQITDYRKPILNMPYFPTTTHGIRLGFTGDYLINSWRYVRSSSQYYEVEFRKDLWRSSHGLSLRETGPLIYPRPEDRIDERFYDLSVAGISDSVNESVWYYVR